MGRIHEPQFWVRQNASDEFGCRGSRNSLETSPEMGLQGKRDSKRQSRNCSMQRKFSRPNHHHSIDVERPRCLRRIQPLHTGIYKNSIQRYRSTGLCTLEPQYGGIFSRAHTSRSRRLCTRRWLSG